MVLLMSHTNQQTHWQNWSGSVTCTPSSIVYPTTLDEIVRIVKDARAARKHIRAVGSGHSFTPLVSTDETLISLDNYAGLESIDADNNLVTVRGGTKIKQLGELLFELGLAQENLGDIDVQSIAGAISTGTHGSGISFGSISTQVTALKIVTGKGEVIECSETQNREIFKTAQVSLGALGVIVSVTLWCVAAYKLHYIWRKGNLSDCLANLEKYRTENRNFEFYWIPYTDAVLLKFMNQTDSPVKEKNLFRRFNELVLENGVLWVLCEICRVWPAQTANIARLIANLISNGEDVNYSHRIFATPRLVRFQEMEYNLPVEHFATALREIDECIRRERIQVHFPLECRFVHADDIALSPAHGRASAYIAVHMYKGMAYRAYFDAVEAIFKKYEGRPHWGKMHTRCADDLSQLYPQWQHFQTVRDSLDPDGVFLNDYLRGLLGVTTPE
jgi:FAD-linked oxidoreductase